MSIELATKYLLTQATVSMESENSQNKKVGHDATDRSRKVSRSKEVECPKINPTSNSTTPSF
jgi:hypothetical protein